MDHFEQTPGNDHGQGESDEALLQKMEQEYRQDDRRFRPLTTRLRELRDDNPMSLTDAATYLGKVTGRKPHVSTLWRWCQKGCKGVRLDSICVGGKRFVTVAAIERFIDELGIEPVAGLTDHDMKIGNRDMLFGTQKNLEQGKPVIETIDAFLLEQLAKLLLFQFVNVWHKWA